MATFATAVVFGVELLLLAAALASALDLDADAFDFDLAALALALDEALTAEACWREEVALLALAATADAWRAREAEADWLLDLDEAALRADFSLEAALIDLDFLTDEADLSEATLLEWATRARRALVCFALQQRGKSSRSAESSQALDSRH